MAANATKTVEYAFATNIGNVSTNTTLAASTRYAFGDIGITIPETTSRNFKSVILECNWRDAFTTVYNFSGWRLGISTGSNAYSDVDYTPTAQANTGDHEHGTVIRDVTDYFNSNFGTSASTSCRAAIAISTATAANVQNLSAKLYITYEYDSTSASRTVKTVHIPIQSASAVLGVTAVEIGSSGTGSAPSNQIPALDTFLPETNKTYLSTWFEMFTNDSSAAVTDINLVYQINAGTTASRCLIEQALNTGCYFYDIWLTKYTNGSGVIIDNYTISASAASAFKAYSSLASRFDSLGGLYCVTYEYDTSSSTVMNSMILPVEPIPIVASTSASNASYISREFWVTEPNVSLAQSGALIYMLSDGGATLNFSAGAQISRPYTLTALVNSGGFALVHRVDYNSGFSLSRGKNILNLKGYTSAVTVVGGIAGFIYLNYTSNSAVGGEVCHNHTTIWHNISQATTGAQANENEILISPQRTPDIISPYYFLNGIGYEIDFRYGSTSSNIVFLSAEKLTGEYNEDGWCLLDSMLNWAPDGELSFHHQITSALDKFNQDTYRTGKMNIETPRTYRVLFSTTACLFWMRTYLTYHSNIFTVSGSLVNPSASGSDVRIDVYRTYDNYWSGSTLTTSSGSYVAYVFDNVYPYFASASQDIYHIGRSASALAV